jgi:hypothetical protein
MITKIKGTCQYENCGQPATHIACAQEAACLMAGVKYRDKPRCFCQKHAEAVSVQTHPEYTCECPNCHCIFGVN